MAKIADDFDVQWVTVEIPLDLSVKRTGSDMLAMYCHASGRPQPPTEFNDKDRWLLLELLMWGECEEKPRDKVIEWCKNNPMGA